VQHRLFAVAQIGGKYPGRRLSMQLSGAPITQTESVRPVRRDDEALEFNDLIVIVDAARNLGPRIPPNRERDRA
jgi:hypothetical protein